MSTIKIAVHAYPEIKTFARKVINRLVTELTTADVSAKVEDHSPIGVDSNPEIVALIFSTPGELERIRNGSVRPNLSFKISPLESVNHSRDYSVAILTAAVDRILSELSPDNLTILRTPEGLNPIPLETLMGRSVQITLN